MIDSMPHHNPDCGIKSIPFTGLGYWQNRRMLPRLVLANNLKALMASRVELSTFRQIVAATDGRLSNGKLDRIRRGLVATDVDTLAELASLFDLEPWQLLIEGLIPQSPPTLANAQMLDQIRSMVMQGSPAGEIKPAPPYVPYRTKGKPPMEVVTSGGNVKTNAPNNSKQRQALLDQLAPLTMSPNESTKPSKVQKQGTNRRA